MIRMLVIIVLAPSTGWCDWCDGCKKLSTAAATHPVVTATVGN